MTKEDALAKLESQLKEAEELKQKRRDSPEFKKWRRDTEVAIERIFGEDTRHLSDFRGVTYHLSVVFPENVPERRFQQAYVDGLARAQAVLKSFVDEIKEYGYSEKYVGVPGFTSLTLIERISSRFHLVARQLRSRHEERNTLEVEDEYDVQDLFHALLKLHFDDVRPEEYSPSYAGSSSRLDFLLKQESIVVEIKKTRKGLEAKDVGEQLIIDIQRYQNHPDCETLICFVYDPEGRIANPRGLENDLNRTSDGLDVIVYVKPTMG